MDIFEKENRTTIAAIVAIVLIVFAVSAYFHIEKNSVSSEENIQGMASKGFQGVRIMTLEESDFGVVHLSINDFKRKYVIRDDVVEVFGKDKLQELHLDKVADSLYVGQYIDEGKTLNIAVNHKTREFIIQGLFSYDSEKLLRLVISDQKRYSGSMNVLDESVYASYEGLNLELISNQGTDYVTLKNNEGLLAGLWNWKGTEHVIILDRADKTITFYDMY